jgi:type II secretory pathway pseudopilin PulG
MINSRRRSPRRAGISLLELEVALVVFGVALAGIAPLVVMHLKQLAKLEARLDSTTTYYLSPDGAPWVRKLGAAATITDTLIAPVAQPPITGSGVEILSIDKPLTTDEVTVRLSIQGGGS